MVPKDQDSSTCALENLGDQQADELVPYCPSRDIWDNQGDSVNKSLLPIFTCYALISCADVGPVVEATAEPDQGNSDERAALAAGSALPQPVVAKELLSCEPMAGMTPYCGYQNPEDLVHIPDTDLLIVSEMGEFMADSPGGLSLLNMTSGRRETLTIDWANDWAGAAGGWGDENCAAPNIEAFSPHGIDLTVRDDGETALLVVNHGGREAVEFFAVADNGDLSWRGCAQPPGDPFINDVAARRDGGFYVTHMWNKTADFAATAAALQGGKPTGWVWGWTQAEGFAELPGTNAKMPNGIAINASNTTLYVNVYFGGGSMAIDLANGTQLGTVEARQPDNITVDTDGQLWIASHQHDPIGQACTQVTAGPCLLPFQIVKADPETLEREVVVDHDGAPMGYATVALKVGDRIYLGSAHGDRVVKLDL